MRVLITGTTSGLGQAFAQYYLKQGAEVISVNRRESPEVLNGQLSHVLDISDAKAVVEFLELLTDSFSVPDIFILNAGINRGDNVGQFNFRTYREVMETNLTGVLTFVSAIQRLKLSNKKIVCLSSTSNLVPNPGHISYYLSKLALAESFKLLQRADRENDYKTVVLGPVHTNIMGDYAGPQGFQRKIFNALAVSAETAASACAEFIRTPRKVFYFTKTACLFYWMVRGLLKLMPGLYQGSISHSGEAPGIACPETQS